MNIYRGFTEFFDRTSHDVGSVVVVGSFDGVHSGHRRLIAQVNERADQLGLRAVVVTFDPHPRFVLKGENRLLSTIDERVILFDQAGVRDLVIVEFTPQFAALEAEVFVRDYIKEKLRAKLVFTGEGHTFGHNRGGDDEVIEKYGMQIHHIERYDNISSTQIRTAVESGDMEFASRILGADYMVVTPVVDTTKLLPDEGSFECEIDGVQNVCSIEQIKAINQKMILRIKKKI